MQSITLSSIAVRSKIICTVAYIGGTIGALAYTQTQRTTKTAPGRRYHRRAAMGREPASPRPSESCNWRKRRLAATADKAGYQCADEKKVPCAAVAGPEPGVGLEVLGRKGFDQPVHAAIANGLGKSRLISGEVSALLAHPVSRFPTSRVKCLHANGCCGVQTDPVKT